jgi:ABC-type antimicrobial peptide transport system permease subunit
LLPLAAGVAAGIVTAALAARAMSGLLYGIGGFDLLAFAAAVAALMTVALAAGLVPARRVASVDPISALRTE